uniref:Uncharacterized protein n=1 Tax=Picea glauca TaxID=3330 RepID=A0A101LZT3_PICGL|nr:hypothetical protein ABT39_MTgene5409 [Picea glauca]QHR90605.1 hypothetical protein Q903MT_gene4630 [Picea sitchensis]
MSYRDRSEREHNHLLITSYLNRIVGFEVEPNPLNHYSKPIKCLSNKLRSNPLLIKSQFEQAFFRESNQRVRRRMNRCCKSS